MNLSITCQLVHRRRHMPLSGSEQQQIQMMVDAASKEERQEMCVSAEVALL